MAGLFPFMVPAESGGDPNWASVVLLAQMANADTSTTFDDDSTSNHTITPSGNAQQDDAQAPTGMSTSGLLDGTGDYLTVTTSTDFDLGTADATIEVWFRANTIATSDPLFGWEDMFTFEFAAGPKLAMYHVDDGYGAGLLASTTNFSTGTWYHIAIAVDGGTTRLYVDGTQEDTTATVLDHSNNGSSQEVFIGTNDFSTVAPGARCFDGWLSSFRVTKGVCRYPDGTGFTPPTLPLPIS